MADKPKEVRRKNTVFGPPYEDGSGDRYRVVYETNRNNIKGEDEGPRLTIHQFNDEYIFVEGPYIEGFLDAIKTAMS